jgi:hypothetical protein
MAAVNHNYGATGTPAPVAIGTRGEPNFGSTFLGDLVTKVNFGSYVREQVYGNYRWVQSGIIQRNSTLDLSSGGTRITVPYFRPWLATEEVIDSNTTWGASGAGYLTPQKINADSQVAAVFRRGFSWAADDISKLGSGADPMAAIASYLVNTINKNSTATLKAMLDGVLGVAGLASHTVNVARTAAGTSAEANFLSAANVIKATNVMGENAGLLTNIAMHSSVYNYLKVVGMLTFSSSSLSTGGNIAWGGGGIGVSSTQVSQFAGFNVIVDDTLAPTTSTTNGDSYPVYLFGNGAVQMGVQQDLRIEYERNILSLQDIAACSYHHLLHIDGVSYVGTDNPTNTVLSTAGSWALKYDHRQIPVVKIQVNSPFSANP